MAAYREPMKVDARAPTIAQQPHSPWHSPVPYLFGGLAAMLGLIAFALLILACSYWKLSGYLESGEPDRDIEAGDSKTSDKQKQQQGPYEEKILVIMAGQDKPTFLATPVSSSTNTSRSSSFGDNSGSSTCTCDQKGEKSVEMAAKQGSGAGGGDDQVRSGGSETETETETHDGDASSLDQSR